jgi:hypothetical protein
MPPTSRLQINNEEVYFYETSAYFCTSILFNIADDNIKRDEVTGEWRRLHNKELNALYSSPNIIRVIKSRRLRWAGHVARMGGGEVHTGI